MEKWEAIKSQWDRMVFGVGSPEILMVLVHLCTCKFEYLIASLILIKVTYVVRVAYLENNGIAKKIFASLFSLGICFIEFWYQKELIKYSYVLFIDSMITFYRPFKFYYNFVNRRIKVGGFLDNFFWIHDACASVAVWKLYDPSTLDSSLPFAIAYLAPPLVYFIFYVFEVYVLKRF